MELVAFDIAGTTLEEHGAVYTALEEAVAAGGGDVTRADVERWMGADKREAITALLGGRGDVDATLEDFRRRLRAAYRDTPPRPFAGVPELFARLRARGIRVALTTGFDHEIADALLASVGWADGVLDAVVCAEDVGAGRPDPGMVRRAMELCGVTEPEHVAVVGDTVLDVRSGRNAGAGLVVAVLSGGVDRAALEREGPTHVLQGAAQLEPVLVEAEVAAALRALVGLPYDGEPVDQLEHALQAAHHARAAGADRELVLAALLHDVARSPEVAGEPYDAGPLHHGEQGARWLAPLLGERVAWLAGAHVAAKRYLVATEPRYAAELTDVSARTLLAQGGAMDAEEVRAFASHPWWREAVQLRRWDDLAKVPGAEVDGLATHLADIRAQAQATLAGG